MMNTITRTLKHSCYFDKKQKRLKTIFFVSKTIYSAYICKKPYSKKRFENGFLHV